MLKFLMRRVDHAVAIRDWKYRPVNHGPYVNVPLKFKETPAYGLLLATAVGWMAASSYEEEQLTMFKYRARTLFEAAFGDFDAEVVQFIRHWSETADEEAFKLIANLLEEAPHTFVFTHVQLTVDLLTKAQRVGPVAYEALNLALYRSTMTGVRSGTAGEPFPRDLEAKEQSEKVLADLSRFSPAYELYKGILQSANTEIKRSLREDEEIED